MKGNLFNTVRVDKPRSNTFDLSHDVKLSFDMGELVPTCVVDVVPGDTFRINTETLLRFAPLISPVMHRVNVTTHAFFVPNRLIWPQWEKWITGDAEVEAPYFLLAQYEPGALGDYLGYPIDTLNPNVKASPMAIAAYELIFQEYYRDQNLQAEEFIPLTGGDNTTAYGSIANGKCRRRAWMHDYFTSCLPWPQKGDDVLLPLTNTQSVIVEPVDSPINPARWKNAPGTGSPGAGVLSTLSNGDTDAEGQPVWLDPMGTLKVDVDADAVTINSLRYAFRLQEWLEKNARGGTRYIEHIRTHFGVKSSDARLQRPEYLGGAHQKMVISEVLSTARTETFGQETDVITPIGQMGGHGISIGAGDVFTYRAEEHGHIIIIVNVQPLTAYQQGLHKMFTRFSPYDYFYPSFAHLGEQPVLSKEVYAESEDTEDLEEVFGYVPRYAEYKFLNSRVAGEMRDTLSFWHLGRIFDSRPVLNESFISANPSRRIFAVTDEETDTIYAHVFNNIKANRLMPKFGTPSF